MVSSAKRFLKVFFKRQKNKSSVAIEGAVKAEEDARDAVQALLSGFLFRALRPKEEQREDSSTEQKSQPDQLI